MAGAQGREGSRCNWSLEEHEPFSMLAIANPCNPTGEYLSVERLKRYVEKSCGKATTVLVDESLQLWRGPDRRRTHS